MRALAIRAIFLGQIRRLVQAKEGNIEATQEP